MLHYRDHIKAALPVTAAGLPHIQPDSPMTSLLVQTWISWSHTAHQQCCASIPHVQKGDKRPKTSVTFPLKEMIYKIAIKSFKVMLE